MTFAELIQSEKLYPLWRISLLEKAFFIACRRLGKQEATRIFLEINRGHDTSVYQGNINFFRMVESGARFDILRVSYGNKKDLKFDEHMAGINGLLPTEAYHYYDPIYSPAVQAAKTIEALAPYKARITRLWIDLEYELGGNYTSPLYWMAYRNLLNEAGYKTGIYTRATWWDSRVGGFEFSRDPMWAAQYSSALTLIPKGWTSAMIWQKGALIYDAGQTSQRIDYDIWNDEFNFDNEWQTVTPPPPTGEPPMTLGTAREAKGNIASVRNAPDVSGAKIGTIPGGATISFMELVPGSKVATDKWLKLSDGTSYVNQFVGGVTYFTILTMPIVTPPPPPPVPVGDTQINMTLKADGTITGTWTDI